QCQSRDDQFPHCCPPHDWPRKAVQSNLAEMRRYVLSKSARSVKIFFSPVKDAPITRRTDLELRRPRCCVCIDPLTAKRLEGLIECVCFGQWPRSPLSARFRR